MNKGRKAAVITCSRVTYRYMTQATRKQMQKTRRTSTAVPLGEKRGEKEDGVPALKKKGKTSA